MKRSATLFIILLCILPISPATGATPENLSMARWNYTSYRVDYHDDWTAKLVVSDPSTASFSHSADQSSMEITCMKEEGRGELSSGEVHLDSFTWYLAEVKYSTHGSSDSLITMAGLFPDSSRSLMDLAILPHTNGQLWTHRVLLHTGASEGIYHFSLGITGTGRAVFHDFSFKEYATYEKPSANLMIVDLLKLNPDSRNLKLWGATGKFSGLFGFGDPAYVHPLSVKASQIKDSDPGLIIFSPTAIDATQKAPGFLRKRKFERGIKKIIQYAEESGIPVMGICAGHQSIAIHYGGFLARLKDDESGQYLTEIGPTNLRILKDDPIFSELPRGRILRIVEAHMIVVHDHFPRAENLAESSEFSSQIFRYDQTGRSPWYTFQGHIEKDWEYACPEGYLVMNNILNQWGLIQDRTLEPTVQK